MSDAPTPRNDEFTAFCNGLHDASHLVALDKFARELERELAETREQRDKLAEALQPFINGWSDKSCDSIVTEQQFRDAKQALAAERRSTMTRLENMTQFLLEYGVNPKKEPINTVLFHLKAAESELAEAREKYRMSSVCRKIKEQRDELSGHYHRLNAENVILQQQRDMLAEALIGLMSDPQGGLAYRVAREALAAVKGETP